MLRDDELPPLPPVWWAYNRTYTADQMREYGRAVEKAAYAAAIKACEGIKEQASTSTYMLLTLFEQAIRSLMEQPK